MSDLAKDLEELRALIENPKQTEEAKLLGRSVLALLMRDPSEHPSTEHAHAAQDTPVVVKGLDELVATLKQGQEQSITALIEQGHDQLLAELETSCKWAGAVGAGQEVAAALKTWREAKRPEPVESHADGERQLIFTK